MHQKDQHRNETTTSCATTRILVCGALCMLLGAGLSMARTLEGSSLSGHPGAPALSAGDGVCPIRYAAEGPSEFEPEQSATGAVRYSATDSEEAMSAKGTYDTKPLWRMLSDMSPAERQNVDINFEAFDTGDIVLLNRINQATDLWNRGDTSTAVTIVRMLEDAGNTFALGISWKAPRVPAKMNTTAIGSHGSSRNPHLDGHTASGNAFIAMQDTDGADHWGVFLSSDGGRTWAQTYYWTAATGNTIPDIGGVVVGDYFYVTYALSSSPGSARVRRFHASTGESDTSYGVNGWLEAFDSDPNDIVELQLTSNQDDNNNRLYLVSILSNGTLAFVFTDENGGDGSLVWTPIVTGVTDANDHLDVAYCAGAVTGDYFLFAVFRGTDNNIYAYRVHNSGDGDTKNLATYFGISDLHISAYRHHVVVVYQYDNAGADGIKYKVSYNDGDSWASGTIDDGSNGNCYEPDVTLRRGGGIVVVYQRDLAGYDLMFMRTRTYSNTLWSNITAVTDAELNWGTSVGLEALPEGGPGIIWFSSDEYAHFDQTPIIWRNNFEFGDTMGWN